MESLYRGAHFLHDSDELVPERVADAGIRHEPVIQMQVGSADARTRYAHDRVAWVLDLGGGLVDDADAIGSAIGHGEHSDSGRD
jgi:hypothetical protein